MIGLYKLDEIGKEEVIIHGQNNEKTEICTKEGPRNERFDDGEAGHVRNRETLGESTIFSKESTNFFIEWMLYLSCFLMHHLSGILFKTILY